MSNATTGSMSGSMGGSKDDKKRGSLLGRFNAKLQDAVEQGRSEDPSGMSQKDLAREAAVPADDMAIRQGQSMVTQRMILPQGVVIEGTLSSGSDAQVSGHVKGDVNVTARLALEESSVVSGKVHATSCSIRGRVEGDVESEQDLIVGEGGVINADAIAGKDMTLSGTINGNIRCGGKLRITTTAKLNGNIRARTIVLEDGAQFNGTCSMTKPGGAPGHSK